MAYFHELMLLAELAFKTTAVTLIAAIQDDKNRLRYQASHSIVRADGLGDWATTLEDILTGPPLQFMVPDALLEQRELTQKVNEDSWQHLAVAALHRCLARVDSELQPVTKYDGRRWFHLFVRLRNKTKAHGVVRPELANRLCPDLDASIKAFVNNFGLFKREWAYLHRNLSGKYRVVSLGNGTSHFEHLKSTKQEQYENGVYTFFGAPRRIALLNSNVDLDDFYLPNGDFTNIRFECVSYITADKIFEPSASYLMPKGALPESETEGVGSLEVQGQCFTNLPSESSSYVSRPELEVELSRVLLRSDQYPIVTLYGGGGIGKTSLALRVAHALTAADDYSLIIWFSARDIDLLSQGPKIVKPRVLTIRDVANEFSDLVNPPGIREKASKAREVFEEHLSKPILGAALYVFDNFETVTNPTEIFNWLDTFIRLPNKVLITTRHREFKGDYPIKVLGMKENELDQLIAIAARKLHIEQLLTSAYINEIKAEADGHPYVAKMLLGTVAQSKQLKKVERIIASSDEILAALFERTYAKLSPAARRCFLTICGWRSNIPVLAVEAVLLQSSEERFDIREAIDELENYSFIEVTKSEKDGEEFIVVPLVASTFGAKKVSVDPLKDRIQSDIDLLQQFGGAQTSDVRHGVAPRISKLIKFIAREIEGDSEALAKYAPMIEFIARRHPQTWLQLSELYLDQGPFEKLEEAKDCLRRFLESATGNDAIEAWRHLANLCRESNDTLGEVHALLQLCQHRNVPFHEISNAANRLNTVFAEGTVVVDGEEKRNLFRRLASIMADRISEASATDLSRLAWLHLNLHDEAEARKFTRQGLSKEINNWYCVKLAIHLGISTV